MEVPAAGINFAGIAAVLTAIAVLVAACSAAYVSFRTTRTVKQTHGLVTDINHAVNGKPPGGQTMQSQVADLHREIPDAGPDSIRAQLSRLIDEFDEFKKGQR